MRNKGRERRARERERERREGERERERKGSFKGSTDHRQSGSPSIFPLITAHLHIDKLQKHFLQGLIEVRKTQEDKNTSGLSPKITSCTAVNYLSTNNSKY